MNNNEIGNNEELNRLNRRIQTNKITQQPTKESIRGRELNINNRKVTKRYKLNNRGKLILYNTIGAAAIVSTILMGVAYSQAKDRLIKQRGGTTFTDPRAGFTSIVGVEEPTFSEVVEFMFKGEKGKGR